MAASNCSSIEHLQAVAYCLGLDNKEENQIGDREEKGQCMLFIAMLWSLMSCYNINQCLVV